MTNELKPVNCGCGGEAKVDWTVINGAYMAGVVCQKCGTKTTSFYDRDDKDKVIAEAITAWNRAMRRVKVDILPNTSEDKGEMPFCPHCGDELEWE